MYWGKLVGIGLAQAVGSLRNVPTCEMAERAGDIYGNDTGVDARTLLRLGRSPRGVAVCFASQISAPEAQVRSFVGCWTSLRIMS